MELYVGLDVSLKRTAICVVDVDGVVVWEGWSDTHPEMIVGALKRVAGRVVKVGLETGSDDAVAGACAQRIRTSGGGDGPRGARMR